MQTQVEIEKINIDAILPMVTSVRQKTWDAVYAIKDIIQSGMSEKHAIKMANQYLADQGVKKFWHKTHIRFGESTILSFNDPYLEEIILKENDIFYIDIGPVWDGIEGDCGKTFVMGENKEYEKIAQDVEVLFQDVSAYYKKNNPTGQQLYQYSQNLVGKMNYLLEPSYVKGHRLSEFSHFQYAQTGTFDLNFQPSPERWILEFQICPHSKKFGAFYEDILI